jgi:orotidine-5'-phosphate decarboxylase
LTVLPGGEENKVPLYQQVIQETAKWGNDHNMMFVIGATHPGELKLIRTQLPSHFLLIPGVGVQGGNLGAVSQNGMNSECGLLVNASRAIIYASEKEDFREAARLIAAENQQEMKKYLLETGLL